MLIVSAAEPLDEQSQGDHDHRNAREPADSFGGAGERRQYGLRSVPEKKIDHSAVQDMDQSRRQGRQPRMEPRARASRRKSRKPDPRQLLRPCFRQGVLSTGAIRVHRTGAVSGICVIATKPTTTAPIMYQAGASGLPVSRVSHATTN